MNIFIYGNQNFKKDIQNILKTSKIDTILDNVKIEEINNIELLKEKITINPNDIYLIDEDKIIKKSRFKFLKAKDGIEENFLLHCGVNELSINSLEEIPNYILRKYEKSSPKDEASNIKEEDLLLDSELSELLESKNEKESVTIQSSVLEEPDSLEKEPLGLDIGELDGLIDISPKEESEIISDLEDFTEDFGLNNINLDYDDDTIFNDSSKSDEDLLADILNANIVDEDDYEFIVETFEDVNFLDELFPNKTIFVQNEDNIKPINIVLDDKKEEKKSEKNIEIDELMDLDNFNFDLDFHDENLKEDIEIKAEEKEPDIINLEDIENLELDNLDFLDIEEDEKNVKDIEKEEERKEEKIIERSTKGVGMSDEFLELDGLNEQDLIEALGETAQNSVVEKKDELQKTSASVDLNSLNASVEDISSLISKLLNNKTLEITIKVKE